VKRRKIGTFEELMALDPKKFKFHSVLSPEESRKAIEESKRPITLEESHQIAREDFKNTKKPRVRSIRDLQ